MRFRMDRKNTKYEVEADVEKIIEKGMDLREKDWKDKFNTKHEAKKKYLN